MFLYLFYILSFLLYSSSSKHINSSNLNYESKFENVPSLKNSDDSLKLICYYGSWAVYRPGRGKFPVEEIDPFLCSHIIYGFAGLSYDNKIRPLDPYNDLKENWGKGAFLRFTGLKKINKKLKTMIAIGGWNEGSVKYSNMASNPESRKIFVDSVMDFLERYNFDGLDFDWEYPGSRGGKSEDKRNFVALLKELKQAFQPKGYILSSAVAAGKHFMDPAYDVAQISKYLDIINVMCYDYHGSWETKTGHHSPLYARPNQPDDYQLNVNFSVNYWISKGAPRNKIVLGMGTYGRAFTLRKAEDHDIGSPAPQKGQAGPYTREGGSLGYNEICEMKIKHGEKIKTHWNSYHLAPYSYWDRQWVGYDNIKSIEIKAKYIKAMGLAGGMVWSIETDDFGGYCGSKYPLLNTIKRVFQSSEPTKMPLPNDGDEEIDFTKPSTSISSSSIPATSNTITTTSHESPTATTRCTRTSTKFTSSMTMTTTQKPTSTTTITNKPTDVPATASSNGWWSNSTPWWPQKPLPGVSPSSEMWWSSTFSTINKKNHNPNSIEEKVHKNLFNHLGKNDFICHGSGLFRNPEACTKFIRCVETKIEGQFQLFFYECPDKTVFNNVTKLCDWVENVPECIYSVPQYYFRGNIFNFQHNLVLKGNNPQNEKLSKK